MHQLLRLLCFFFFDATPTTDIYTLSLHDALPISHGQLVRFEEITRCPPEIQDTLISVLSDKVLHRSEEHTSELQSRGHLVCRLLLEKKKTTKYNIHDQQRKREDREFSQPDTSASD